MFAIARLPPAFAALLAHVPGLVLVAILPMLGVPAPLSVVVAAVGVSAALVAHLWKLPVWWRLINLTFVPMLWLALQVEIAPGWFLAGFLVLALTSLGAVRTRVPLYLSSARAAEALAERIPEGGRLIDLGCGLGGPLARVHALRPDVRLHGVEAAPLNWLIARLRLLGRAQVGLGSLWDVDLADYDVVYAYLSPVPMARLWDKARAEMRPGSLLISNTFEIPGVTPDEIVELHDFSHARLLIRRMR